MKALASEASGLALAHAHESPRERSLMLGFTL
jgi:hypothetical protein